MLGQRRRRWANIKPTLAHSLMVVENTRTKPSLIGYLISADQRLICAYYWMYSIMGYIRDMIERSRIHGNQIDARAAGVPILHGINMAE